MDVSKNRETPPKWMVQIMENPIKIDDLGVPLFLETPIYFRMCIYTYIYINTTSSIAVAILKDVAPMLGFL